MPLDMPTILRLSKVPLTPYDLENVKQLSSTVLRLFSQEDLDNAIAESLEEQFERGEERSRTQVLIPCNTDSLTPLAFQDLLLDHTKHQLKLGEATMGPPIYGRRNSAFIGKTVTGRYHRGFLVYDSGAGILVDQVSREGTSFMNPTVRSEYISFLESRLGCSLAWRERSLCDISG